MPGIPRTHTFEAGDVLTAASLESEFDNVADNILRINSAETITSAWTFSGGLDVDSGLTVDGGATINDGLTLGTALALTEGGSGATTAGGARTSFGLGTIATEDIEDHTKAQAGGQNVWVQASSPTAVATGDLWVDTS